MEFENNGQFKSRLQAPTTKMPETARLTEVSDAAQNARAKPSMLPPPTGVKRKTLAEQAVEYIRPIPPAPSSKLPGATVKAGSIPSLSRNASSTSTASTSRSTSAASTRTTSNSSNFSQSLGPGRNQSFRPLSSMSLYQQTPRIPKPGHRPASSLDTPAGQAHESNGQTINSMRHFSSSKHNTLHSKKSSDQHRLNHSLDSTNHVTEPLHVPKRSTNRVKSLREISISTRLGNLSLSDDQSLQNGNTGKENIGDTSRMPKTPLSHIPKKKKKPSILAFDTPTPSTKTTSPTKSTKRKAPPIGGFLTIDSNVKCADWDVNDRLDKMETMYTDMKAAFDGSNDERDNLRETMALLKARNSELESEMADLKRIRSNLERTVEDERNAKSSTQSAFDELTRKQLLETTSLKQAMDDQRRAHNIELDDSLRQKRRELEDLQMSHEEEQKKLERTHREEVEDVKKKLEESIETEKEQRRRELNAITTEGTAAQQKIEQQLLARDQDVSVLQAQLEKSKAETAFEREQLANLKSKLSESSTTIISLESSLRSSKARVEFLESDNKSQSQAFADLEQRTQDAIRESEETRAQLRAEETLRRKLHNQVQELKGNIRVYCRVRPTLDSDEADQARIVFPDQEEDAREIDVVGLEEKTALGKISTKNHAFTFDRVFSPAAQNAEIFDELSQLVQSALDGYNVCIFCYGQTGSGKTYTMSSPDGMIPLAVKQIYDTARNLEEKGWKYSMEGSFVEIYNETINDLLGSPEFFDDKKRHDVRHPEGGRTYITNLQPVKLETPERVHQILAKAMKNRSVAATMANARSSRSHSVFILSITGENAITGERSEGTLSLVDLAGSERLSHSGATGDRLRETQNINKSLSSLGDVISSLAQGTSVSHIPFRNSKLTYLLQNSLGGNSKTLMFVMVSPLQAHLKETLTSLNFALKVNNTKIGTARKQTKVKEPAAST